MSNDVRTYREDIRRSNFLNLTTYPTTFRLLPYSNDFMKTLKQLCNPRQSVFDRARKDTVLDLTDLIEDRLNAEAFFAENFITDGMKRLLQESFRRFSGNSEQGIFVLSQAMGGGKTHNMMALGLLAKHPELRKKVMASFDESGSLGAVRVVAFTGRESDAPLGIWGAIADQLGQKELFNDYYSPLSAPGQTAWTNLLKGEPLLILLDELPPYLDNAESKTIGDSNLARVTTTAISNLLTAVSREALSNVCVVISDLKATYEGGSQQINRALENLKGEVGRGAIELEPVASNTGEIYHILRTRLFKSLPAEDEVWTVARAYADAVKNAKQMDITNASPEQFAAQIKDSYPFHFAIRDLYARFRENPGFQQTRGLIRLMRVLVSRLFDEAQGKAEQQYLIHAHDLDFNDRETLSEITLINPTLDNAISHDIASEGQAIAENLDSNLGGTNAQDACKLLLVSSLANVPNALTGLSPSEIISYLCEPGRDVSGLQNDVLKPLYTKAWYLHANRDGKLYFKNVQNLVAKLKTTAEAYNRESSLKELKTFLQASFDPKGWKDCYQDVLVFPAIDEIQAKIRIDRVTLMITEPSAEGGLAPELTKFYEDIDYKNRVLFLTGSRNTLESLLETAAELKAIGHILKEMADEKVPDNDPQLAGAKDIKDGIQLRLLSAMRETFTSIEYPTGQGLIKADFLMQWTDNAYNGEQQIRDALKAKQKFTEDVSSDTFRKKCEQRLFTQKSMTWTEVKKRAATNPLWPWHRMDALDVLKDDLIHKDQWREDGGYVEKPPFPKPETDVRWFQAQRDSDTGEVTLKLTPVNGDTLYYEIGALATTASQAVPDAKAFKTAELEISFLCVDSQEAHGTGEPRTWRNEITLKSVQFQQGSEKRVELQAAPPAPILYTTDGSDPKLMGGSYEGPFAVLPGTVCVLAIAQKAGLTSEVHRLDIRWDAAGQETVEIKPDMPVCWKRRHQPATTKDTYEFLERLKKYEVSVSGASITINGQNWVQLSADDRLQLQGQQLEETVNHLRGLIADGEVEIEVRTMHFNRGQLLLDWVQESKTELTLNEVEQQS